MTNSHNEMYVKWRNGQYDDTQNALSSPFTESNFLSLVRKESTHMALVTCKEDGKEVGPSAEVCPGCGAKYVPRKPWLWMLTTCAVLWSSLALSQNQPVPSSVQESQPELGSRIRKTISSSERIPLNKTWSQLTAEERASLRANYEQMPETDEPPYPLKGMAPIIRQLSDIVGFKGIEGIFRIHVTVDGHGNATKADLIEYTTVEEAKIVAYVLVKKTKYKPAVCHGVPCTMDFPFRFRFEVR